MIKEQQRIKVKVRSVKVVSVMTPLTCILTCIMTQCHKSSMHEFLYFFRTKMQINVNLKLSAC